MIPSLFKTHPSISWFEFIKGISGDIDLVELQRLATARKYFDQFDINLNGSIEVTKFREMLQILLPVEKPEEIDKLVELVCKEKEEISWSDFIRTDSVVTTLLDKMDDARIHQQWAEEEYEKSEDTYSAVTEDEISSEDDMMITGEDDETSSLNSFSQEDDITEIRALNFEELVKREKEYKENESDYLKREQHVKEIMKLLKKRDRELNKKLLELEEKEKELERKEKELQNKEKELKVMEIKHKKSTLTAPVSNRKITHRQSMIITTSNRVSKMFNWRKDPKSDAEHKTHKKNLSFSAALKFFRTIEERSSQGKIENSIRKGDKAKSVAYSSSPTTKMC